MGKTLGNPTEIIRSLRKDLAAAQEEIRSCRGLRAENARLKEKIDILQKMAKLLKDGYVVSPSDSGASSTSGPASWYTDQTPPTNIGRSMGRAITIEGDRYVYHDGELIQLNTRLERIRSRPTYMHPTQASEAKVRSDMDSRIDRFKDYSILLKKGPDPYNWEAKRLVWMKDNLSEQLAGWEVLDQMAFKGEWVHIQRSPQEREPEPETGDSETFRLREKHKHPLHANYICSKAGEAILRRGLRFLQESFTQ